MKIQSANAKPSVEGMKPDPYFTIQVPPAHCMSTVSPVPTHVLQCHLERRRGDVVARQQQDGRIKDVALIGTISIVTSQVKEIHTKSVYHTHSPHGYQLACT